MSSGDFVLAEPEISQFTMPLTGGRLILASDGLWDSINHKTACHHTRGQPSTKATRALVGLDHDPVGSGAKLLISNM